TPVPLPSELICALQPGKCAKLLYFLTQHPPDSTLSPYTTLFRSSSAHRLIRTWVRLRTSASPDFTVMSMRAVPTAASTAPTVAVSLSEVVGDVGGPASASGTSTGAENRVR